MATEPDPAPARRETRRQAQLRPLTPAPRQGGTSPVDRIAGAAVHHAADAHAAAADRLRGPGGHPGARPVQLRPAPRPPVVQARGLLRGAGPRLPRLEQRRHRGPARADRPGWTTCSGSASTACGCCPSTTRRCGTAATTSPTSPRSCPSSATSATSSSWWTRRTSAASGSSRTWSSTTPATRTRGSRPPAATRTARTATSTSGPTPTTGTRTRGSSSSTPSSPTGPSTRSAASTTGTGSSPTSPT